MPEHWRQMKMLNFGEAWTCLAKGRYNKARENEGKLDVAQGVVAGECLEAIAKGNKALIPIADLARCSLRTGRCRSAFGVRGAVGWSG